MAAEDPIARLRAATDAHRRSLDQLASVEADFEAAATFLVDALNRGGQVLLCGNGGSAADAQHIAGELTGRFVLDRRPLPALALNTNSTTVTAIGNDFGFGDVFARQVIAHGRPGDVLIAISTSGGSPNVLAAVAAAREKLVGTIALTGPRGGPIADGCDVAIRAPGETTARVQEMHILIAHALCEVIDHAFA